MGFEVLNAEAILNHFLFIDEFPVSASAPCLPACLLPACLPGYLLLLLLLLIAGLLAHASFADALFTRVTVDTLALPMCL